MQDQDRRQFYRLESSHRITIKLQGQEHRSWSGAPTYLHDTLDISRNGLSFRTYEHFPANSPLLIEVQLSDPPKRLTLAGVVRWSSMIGDDDLYSVGVELIGLREEDGQAWLSYIDAIRA